MKKIPFTLTALAFAVAGGALAYAAETPRGAAMGDQMRDPMRVTTRAEAQTHAEKLFTMLDVNHDGKLDKADRVARRGAMFDRLDANHDGNVSRSEFDTPPPPPASAVMGKDGAPPPPIGFAPRRGGKMMPMQAMHMMGILRMADPNRSGSVGKDAFVAAALKMFDEADANHDGKVTPEERKAAHQAMRGKMEQEIRHHRGMGGMKMGAGEMPPPPPPPPPPAP